MLIAKEGHLKVIWVTFGAIVLNCPFDSFLVLDFVTESDIDVLTLYIANREAQPY